MIHEQVKVAAAKRILFLPHAIQQMVRPERLIDQADVANIIVNGEVIEDYPEDVRGHSCLLLGYDQANRAVHVVCAPKAEYIAVITAYIPSPAQWSADFRRRIA